MHEVKFYLLSLMLTCKESDSSSTFSPTLKNPTSPVFTNPQASLERMRALALVDNEYMDEETDDGVIKKRQHVYRELVETEQVYLDDLKIVIDVSGYWKIL